VALPVEWKNEFSKLLDNHSGIVWKVAYAWCRQAADRDDLVQEIILQLWRAFPRFDRSRSFPTWMYRIALNVAISSVRRRSRFGQEPLSDALEPMVQPPCHEEQEQLEWLFATIESLEATDRALLLLWLDDYSYAGIAEVIGLTETNVATRLNRLKRKLKDRAITLSTEDMKS
jgi:RNA polymerase sigma-70 factor (ECF subfamily)